MGDTLLQALSLLTQLDPAIMSIVGLSLQVSLSALVIGSLIGMPFGALLAVAQFPGRTTLVVLVNSFMGMPSVVLGVLVYLMLSRSGPFGDYGLLFSPTAMIIAQTLLVLPLIAALTRQIIEDTWKDYELELKANHLSKRQSVMILLYDCRFSLTVAVLAGLGRAISEVGAVMIVGGNIEGFTRVMTTAIALETSKGDLPLSIALGLVLIGIQIALNWGTHGVRSWAMRRYG